MKLKILISQILIAFLWLAIAGSQTSFAQTPKPAGSQSVATVYFSSKPFAGKGAQGAEKSPKFKAGSDIYCRVTFNQPLGKIFEGYDDDEKVLIFYLYQIREPGEKGSILEQSVRIRITPNITNRNYLDIDFMPAPENAVTNNEYGRLSDVIASDKYTSAPGDTGKQVGLIRKFSLNIGIGNYETKKAGAGEMEVDYTKATIKSMKEWSARDKVAFQTINAKAEKSSVVEAINTVKQLPLPKVFLTPYATGVGTISYKEISNEQIISMLEQKYQSKIYLFRFVKPLEFEDFGLVYRGEKVVGKIGNKVFFYAFKDSETGACKASPGKLYRPAEGAGSYGELTIENFFLDVGKYIEKVYPKDNNDNYYVDCDKLK